METLEQAEHYIEVLYICAYVGFALWGIAGWYVGRLLLRRNYIKPKGLVNITLMRQIEDDNFKKNNLIKQIQQEKKHLVNLLDQLEEQNKSLWYWSYAPHTEAHSIIIKQFDKEGDEVAMSDITLPEKKDWVEPTAYADDLHEDFHKWREQLPHNQPED
jgi:hypothetical protein